MIVLSSTFLALLLVSPVPAKFNPLEHSGPASPYFDAPSQFGIDTETPENCVVDQAAYILRHGSRYAEPGSFNGWQALHTKIQNATFTARGPLRFIGSWVVPTDDIPHMSPSTGAYLTSTGALEAFQLGSDLRKKYGFTAGGANFTAWSADQQRCVDTTVHFVRGYLSQGNYLNDAGMNRGDIITLPDSTTDSLFADSLTPSSSCPAYALANNASAISSAYRAQYRPAVAKRINKYLDGLEFTAEDVGIMQDLCGFLSGVNGDTRFCDIFTEDEWLDYEYAHDLNYYYGSGPGNALSATVGYPWVKAISDLFAVGPGAPVHNGAIVPPPLIMAFTHDNNIPPIISALGLWNTSESLRHVYPLSKTKKNPARNFRASYLVSFRGYVALERLTCSPIDLSKHLYHITNVTNTLLTEDQSSYVRVRVNSAPVPIPGCKNGPGSSCPLDKFVEYVDVDMKNKAGTFGDRCGVETDGLDEVRFLTQTSDIYGSVLVGTN